MKSNFRVWAVAILVAVMALFCGVPAHAASSGPVDFTSWTADTSGDTGTYTMTPNGTSVTAGASGSASAYSFGGLLSPALKAFSAITGTVHVTSITGSARIGMQCVIGTTGSSAAETLTKYQAGIFFDQASNGVDNRLRWYVRTKGYTDTGWTTIATGVFGDLSYTTQAFTPGTDYVLNFAVSSKNISFTVVGSSTYFTETVTLPVTLSKPIKTVNNKPVVAFTPEVFAFANTGATTAVNGTISNVYIK